MGHWGGGEAGGGGICARNGHPVHTALASRGHWGLQKLGLLEGRLLGCLQPRKGSVVGDILPSSVDARGSGDGLGPPRHLLAPQPLPAHTKEGLALQMPPVPGPSAPQGPGEEDGVEQGVHLVRLVTDASGLLPVWPPGSPTGGCSLLAPALPALCPTHACVLDSSQLLPFRSGRSGEVGPSEVRSRAASVWWGAGSKGRD